MGLADFYHQNGCTDIESKITALEKRLCQHPWHSMDRKKRLMLLEKEYCKMGSYHNEVKQEASKDDFKNIYDSMLNNKESAYNNTKELTPQEMLRGGMLGGVQFYGKEYYSPRR